MNRLSLLLLCTVFMSTTLIPSQKAAKGSSKKVQTASKKKVDKKKSAKKKKAAARKGKKVQKKAVKKVANANKAVARMQELVARQKKDVGGAKEKVQKQLKLVANQTTMNAQEQKKIQELLTKNAELVKAVETGSAAAKELEIARKKLTEQATQLAEKEKKLVEANTNIGTLTANLAGVQTAHDTIARDLEQKASDLRLALQTAELSDTELNHVRNVLEEKTEELQQVAEEGFTAAAQLTFAKTKNTEFQAHVEELNQQLENLQTQAETKTQELEAANLKLQELTQKLDDKEQQIGQTGVDNTALRRQLDELNAKVAQAQDEFLKANAKYADDIKTLNVERDTHITKLKTEFEKTQGFDAAEKADIQKKFEAASTEIAGLNERLNKATVEREKSFVEYGQINAQLLKADKAVAEKMNEIAAKDQALASLDVQLKQTQEAMARSLSNLSQLALLGLTEDAAQKLTDDQLRAVILGVPGTEDAWAFTVQEGFVTESNKPALRVLVARVSKLANLDRTATMRVTALGKLIGASVAPAAPTPEQLAEFPALGPTKQVEVASEVEKTIMELSGAALKDRVQQLKLVEIEHLSGDEIDKIFSVGIKWSGISGKKLPYWITVAKSRTWASDSPAARSLAELSEVLAKRKATTAPEVEDVAPVAPTPASEVKPEEKPVVLPAPVPAKELPKGKTWKTDDVVALSAAEIEQLTDMQIKGILDSTFTMADARVTSQQKAALIARAGKITKLTRGQQKTFDFWKK